MSTKDSDWYPELTRSEDQHWQGAQSCIEMPAAAYYDEMWLI